MTTTSIRSQSPLLCLEDRRRTHHHLRAPHRRSSRGILEPSLAQTPPRYSESVLDCQINIRNRKLRPDCAGTHLCRTIVVVVSSSNFKFFRLERTRLHRWSKLDKHQHFPNLPQVHASYLSSPHENAGTMSASAFVDHS